MRSLGGCDKAPSGLRKSDATAYVWRVIAFPITLASRDIVRRNNEGSPSLGVLWDGTLRNSRHTLSP